MNAASSAISRWPPWWAGLGIEVQVLPTELDLGARMAAWTRETGSIVSNLVARLRPDAAMSLTTR